MKVIAAGAGPGSELLLTDQIREAVLSADRVFTSDHLAVLAASMTDHFEIQKISETLGFIDEHAGEDMTVCVLASGDTGYYSLASTIRRRLPEGASLELIPGISSMQYLCARTHHSYEHMKLISLHGREGSIVPHVSYNESVFALTGGSTKAGDVIRDLVSYGLGHVMCYVGERLTMKNEKVVSGRADELEGQVFDDLTCMIIDNDRAADPFRVLVDEDFVRGKVPMTKDAIRNLAAAELAVHPGDRVIDVGAGTGAMTCTLALKAHESMVYAVEKNPEAVSLIRQNMDKLGIHNIHLAEGEAPAAMEDFPAADRVFVGGSTGNLREITDLILSKNPAAVILVTAVTMETMCEAFELFRELGMETVIRCINASAAHKLGKYNLMKADNPVWLIKGVQRSED